MGELFRDELVLFYEDDTGMRHRITIPNNIEIATPVDEYVAEVDTVVTTAHRIEDSASARLNSILEDERDNDFRDSIYLDAFLNSFAVTR